MKKGDYNLRDVSTYSIFQAELLNWISSKYSKNEKVIDLEEFFSLYRKIGFQENNIKYGICNTSTLIYELLFTSVWAMENNKVSETTVETLKDFGIVGENSNMAIIQFAHNLRNAIAHSNFKFDNNGIITIWNLKNEEKGTCENCGQKIIIKNKYTTTFTQVFTFEQFKLIVKYFREQFDKNILNKK